MLFTVRPRQLNFLLEPGDPRHQGCELLVLPLLIGTQRFQLLLRPAQHHRVSFPLFRGAGLLGLPRRVFFGERLLCLAQQSVRLLQLFLKLTSVIVGRLEGLLPARLSGGDGMTQCVTSIHQGLPLRPPSARLRLQSVEGFL